MYEVNGDSIKLTKGDTFIAKVDIFQNNEEYIPATGDVVRFALKRLYSDDECLIYKVIPNDTLILKLDPQDTNTLEVSTYYYDIELTFANGDVDTFISGKLKLTNEVE